MTPAAEVRTNVTENSGDHWIGSLQTLILGTDDNKRYGGVQALSIFAQHGKQTNIQSSLPFLTPIQDGMREKILKTNITGDLVKLFKSSNDAVKYCASRALIALNGRGMFGFLSV